MCVCVHSCMYCKCMRVFLQLQEHDLADQAGSVRATPAVMLSQQPTSPAQLISVFLYPHHFAAECQCCYLSICSACVCERELNRSS